MLKTKYWASDINYIWLILPIYCTCSRHLNYSAMRTVTTLQGSGWNNKLSRKGIPSSHCWKGQIKRQVSAHGHGESTEHKELQFQPWEHSGLLTMTQINTEYKQRITGKGSKGKPHVNPHASRCWPWRARRGKRRKHANFYDTAAY